MNPEQLLAPTDTGPVRVSRWSPAASGTTGSAAVALAVLAGVP